MAAGEHIGKGGSVSKGEVLELRKQGDAGRVVYLVRRGRLEISVGEQKVETVV